MKNLAAVSNSNKDQDDEKEENEEEDYMNMVIVEPVLDRIQETYTQRRLRKEREAHERGRAKTKQELAAQEKLVREKALETSLLPDEVTTITAPINNKGLAMMTKMGFKIGAPLGRPDNPEARLEPVRIQMKEDRGGIGMDTERKRLFSDEMNRETKRIKANEGEYRERVRKEQESARLETLVGKAMKIAEIMHEQREEEQEMKKNRETKEPKFSISSPQFSSCKKAQERPVRQSKQINLLWRGLVRKREEKERERRIRSDLQQQQSSSYRQLPTYEDLEEASDNRWAFMGDIGLMEELEDEEDTELDEFNALEPSDRLRMLTNHLRIEHNYCFWCKYAYPNQGMDDCPGPTEQDHD